MKKKISQGEMLEFLEKKWKRKVKYTCKHCLDTAYNATLNNERGYITDEDLIESSNHTLKHK